MNTIYLDAASTTKPVDSVIDVIFPYIREYYHNPSSLYSYSVKVRNDIENVRKQIADLIHAKPEEIYFTSGASEANNWVVRGFDDAYGCMVSRIVSTNMEHASMHKALKNKALLSTVKYLDNDENGIVSIDSIHDNMTNNTSLVSVIAANNEIGTTQDLSQIADVVHSYNGIFHTDATQMLPYVPINVKKMSIDMLSASAQKFGGLKGTGFLYIKNSVKDKIAPLIYGEQEQGMRGGTENVIGIIAMGEAIKHIDYKRSQRMSLMRDCIIDELENIGCKLVGSKDNRLPNHVSVMLPEGCGGEEMLYMLDTSGICISTGSACNSHSKQPSHVLDAIGLTDEEAARVIRITFSSDLTVEDMDKAINEIKKAIDILTSDVEL